MLATIRYLFWNDRERRPRALWRITGQLFLVLVFLIITAIFVILLIQSTTRQLDINNPIFLLYSSAATLLSITVSVWVAGRLLDRRSFADFGLRIDRNWWIDLAFGMGLGAILMLGIFLVQWVAEWITIIGIFWQAETQYPFLLAVIPFILMYIFVGIYEELLTRGYWLRNLAEGLCMPRIGPQTALVLAWLISSAAFGFLHLGNPNASVISTMNIALAGLFLGLGYVLTGSLAISIGLHITWNFFQGNVFGFAVSGMQSRVSFIGIEQGGPTLWTGGVFGPEAGLLGILAMIVGSVLTIVWVRWRYGPPRLHVALTEPPVYREAGAYVRR